MPSAHVNAIDKIVLMTNQQPYDNILIEKVISWTFTDAITVRMNERSFHVIPHCIGYLYVWCVFVFCFQRMNGVKYVRVNISPVQPEHPGRIRLSE